MVEEKNASMKLTIDDLETFHVITETKVKELKTIQKSFSQHQDKELQEHNAVQRVIADLVQILLGHVEHEDALKIFQEQYGDNFGQKQGEEQQQTETTADPKNYDQLFRSLQTQLKEMQYSVKTLVLQNDHAQKKIKEEESQPQHQNQNQEQLNLVPERLDTIDQRIQELVEEQKRLTQLQNDLNAKSQDKKDSSSVELEKLDMVTNMLRKQAEDISTVKANIIDQQVNKKVESHHQSRGDNDEKDQELLKVVQQLAQDTSARLDEILSFKDKLITILSQQDKIIEMQDQNKLLIQQSASIVEKIEQKQEVPQIIQMPQHLQQYKGENQEAQYETYQRVAQNIFDRKVEASWVNQGPKFQVQSKYSFAVMTQQDYVFVDGNHNNVDVLRKDDLSLIGTLKTDNNAVFSFLMQGLKVFVGCANNNLFVFEVDTQKRIKDIKSTNIVYCFHQLDYNTILCGQRDGHIQILQANNLSKIQNFSLKDTSHIIQVNKTFKQSEIIMACSRGLFFADIVDLGDYRLTLSNEVYFREQDIKAAIEYKRDSVATCIDMDLNVYLIDRKQRLCIKTIENPSGSDRPLCMRLIPSFDIEKMPFALLRDQEGITLVNLKNPGAYKIFQSWYHQLPFPQMLLDCYKVVETGAVICYLVEYTGKDSTVVKYELTGDYIGGLKLMAKNDM